MEEVEELALDGAQKLSQVKRLRWEAGDSLTRADWGADLGAAAGARQEPAPQQAGVREGRGLAQQRDGPLECHGRRCEGVAVQLEPMEIRTFKVHLKRPQSAVV